MAAHLQTQRVALPPLCRWLRLAQRLRDSEGEEMQRKSVDERKTVAQLTPILKSCPRGVRETFHGSAFSLRFSSSDSLPAQPFLKAEAKQPGIYGSLSALPFPPLLGSLRSTQRSCGAAPRGVSSAECLCWGPDHLQGSLFYCRFSAPS